jgi:ABC-type sugar transport system substrate-binding protein
LREKTANAVQQRRGLSDAVVDLSRRDVGAVRRLASRIRLAVSSSDEKADGSQYEHDCYRSELTKSRAHMKLETIVPFFQVECASVGGAGLGRFVVRLLGRAIATALALAFATSVAGAAPVEVQVGVVLKALDNPFFVAMYEGVSAESGRRGVSVSVRAANGQADLSGQAALVRSLVAGKKDCYVVNPITSTNVVAALRGVRRPIVNVDSPIDVASARRAGVRISSFIGTNDFEAGRMAAARMVALLPGGGTVALVGGTADSVNSNHRLSGFERGVRATQVRVVARVAANYDRAQAEFAAQRLLRLHPRLSGFFAVNDEMALGVADAVGSAGKTGRVTIIGVDGITDALDAVRGGSINATISQYPYVMGQMAVEACIASARGARLPARVDSPIAVVTKANVARAAATFPRPFRGYSDPFERLLRKRR